MRYNDSMKNKLIEFVTPYLKDDYTGHDLEHALRVFNNAQLIIKNEHINNIDKEIIDVACIVHDVIDEKLCDDLDGRKTDLKTFLSTILNADQINQVFYIIENMSFSKNISDKKVLSLEGKIVQDADRLDSIGAIGIARTFAYGGRKNRKLYDDNINFSGDLSNKDYRDNNNTSINHFYEKLLKLPELMNTEYGKELANKRRIFIEEFLNEFFDEINGKK